MPLVLVPELKNESVLPIYVTGVGIGCTHASLNGESVASAHLLVTTCGLGKVKIGGQTFAVPEGYGLYVDGGVGYEYMPVDDGKGPQWMADWVSFCFTSDKLKNALFTGREYFLLKFNRPAMISEDIRKMLEAVSRDNEYGGFFASSILYSTLIELNRDTMDTGISKEKVSGAVSAAIEYINGHVAENITLDSLCVAAGGLSEQYFCRLFKQHTGTRPIEYILRKRIGIARSYLEKTDIPIPEVAERTGFNNTSYFYRNFKKFMGVSPLTCRQNALHYVNDPNGVVGV